ncbi:NUDIX domain-containing protein [Haloarchaeobius litoreus]|uniref:NUDIX domain-containing protein n=1 Tax=Haloarchaeobius litoreus TaxID=755306 RepID=A0ABD6DHP0_9EURY|nr:NUDIX domain-containing protein [Haloarchaeobius litoreus]
MDVTDPRERYDDLLTERRTWEVDAETFAAMDDNEAFTAGWVTIGVALDGDGRVLLVYNADDEQWVVPGGSVKPGETLPEALVRELDEETGVRVEPVRPHAAVENVIEYEGRTRSFTTVAFEADPTTTAVGENLGEDDEAIERADWFAELPEETFEREFATRLLERVR